MIFTDYQGTVIELTEQVWKDHIQVNHSEISLDEIKQTLIDPEEVWISQSRENVVLYYKRRNAVASGKVRYWMIAVKKISFGNFVSSAMTKSTVVGARLVYKKS